MEYQVIFEINGKREILVLEHVKEEYGVSEQEFWCCWIVNKKETNGEGRCAEEAIMDMLRQIKEIADMRSAMAAMLENNKLQFKTPIIPDLSEMAILQYRNQKELYRRIARCGLG